MNIGILKQSNFEPEEFFKSEIAKKHNINNYTDDPEIIANLKELGNCLQNIRDYLSKINGYDCPIIIHSSYRSKEVNKLARGRENSQHLKGQAADISSPKFGNLAAFFYSIRNSNIIYDQLLLETNCVHISKTRNKNRMISGKYINNKFTKI